MGTVFIPISAGADSREVLLIGDINGAFLDADAPTALLRKAKQWGAACEIRTNMLDAIEMAAKNSFTAIAVVMSGVSAKLASDLKALREVNCDAKIILLAQMYEEPQAMQMVSSAFNGVTLADDYLICPVQTDRFYESIMPAGGGRGQDWVLLLLSMQRGRD